ncbi:MAG: DsbA family protein [Acidobacteria bacterium]|nr:DsbA family protein [Acidobacteriota bacterium]
MRKAVLYAFVCLSAATGIVAQTKKAPAAPKPAAPPAAPAKPQKSALDKPTLEAYIRHQFLLPDSLKVIVEDPKPSDLPGMVLVSVLVTDGGPTKQTVEFFISKDGAKIVQGKVFDVRESPFAGELKYLTPGTSSVAGPANAPVSIYVFSDFQCPYCKEVAKTIRTNLTKDFPTQTRMIFKDFPIDAIHPWARTASIAGRCIAKLNAPMFWEYHDWIFEQQANVTLENVKTKVQEFANSKGLDTLQLTQCIDAKVPEKDIEATIADARSLTINSTPTLFVNGRRLIGNVDWNQLKRVIDYELDYAKKHPEESKKDEPCCELKLPIPGLK